MINLKNKAIILGALLALAGCGGFVYTTIGGTVTGLKTNSTERTLVLQNDGGFQVQMATDGPYTFKVASNGKYAISIARQPFQTNCTIANGTGTMTGEAPRNDVAVTCVPNVPVSGVINGLKDSTSITLITSKDDLVGTGYTQAAAVVPPDPLKNNSFVMTQFAVRNTDYDVTVASQPVAQFCSVTNGKGRVTTQTSITGVVVNCLPAVPVTITVTGLTANIAAVLGITNTITQQGQTLTDTVGFAQAGSAILKKSLLDGASYNVTVSSQPPGQTCTVTGGSGVASLANPAPLSAIAVTCK